MKVTSAEWIHEELKHWNVDVFIECCTDVFAKWDDKPEIVRALNRVAPYAYHGNGVPLSRAYNKLRPRERADVRRCLRAEAAKLEALTCSP